MEKGTATKLIMERSGHQSEGGLSSYERSTPVQQLALSRALTDITNSVGESSKEDDTKEDKKPTSDATSSTNGAPQFQSFTFNITFQS